MGIVTRQNDVYMFTGWRNSGMPAAQGEHKSRFVERVQASIAEELAIPIKDITIQRKREVVRLARKLEKV